MINILAVGCGGFVGAALRYLIGLIPLNEAMVFPVKTFVINIVGCILIGILAVTASFLYKLLSVVIGVSVIFAVEYMAVK